MTGRFALITALAAVFVGVIAMPGSAASFDDSQPCPADGPLLVCPAAGVGQAYSLQLRALRGCDLYRWEIVNGSLPEGLSMSSSGLVTGVARAAGETKPWVVVHDLTKEEGGHSWCGGDNKSERQFVFKVVPGLSIQNQSVPPGTLGQGYSQTLAAQAITAVGQPGSPAAATWSLASGSLPAGVTLSSTGALSGTPTAEGSHTFVVRAQSGGASDTETLTISVRRPISVTSPFANGSSPKAEVGAPLTAAQSATGGEGTFTWAIAGGALPVGVTLNPDGTISGTPKVAGRFSFVIAVTDKEGRSTRVNAVLVVAPKLAIKTLRLRSGEVGEAYRMKVALLGGVGPFTWTLRGKLPAGITFVKKTGTFRGTPRKAGKSRITLQVVDALGIKAQKTLTLTFKA